MCCLSLSQVSLVNEMPDSRGTNLDKWSPRTGHKACNVPASAESSPGQKHNTWFWTLCSLCLNKAWLKHVFVLFLKVIKRWMNKEVQTGDGCGSQQRQRRKWTRACEGRARVCECVCVCFLFPRVHPGDRLGKRPLGLTEVWLAAKKSKTKIERERERESLNLRIKERAGGWRGRERKEEQERWRKSVNKELCIWGVMYGK